MTLEALMKDLAILRPEVVLAVGGMLLLMLGTFARSRATELVTASAIALSGLGLVALSQTAGFAATAFAGMISVGSFTFITKALVLLALLMALILSTRTLALERIDRFEVPVLMVFAALGMLLMISANDLLTLYMGLELQSLALYVLAAVRRDDARSSEAGIKYFVLGALSSGLLLFGISLVYGFAGSTSFDVIANTLGGMAGAVPAGVLIGLVFILAGLVFKVSGVPFHMWTPDVYQGAPTIITAFFATVPKLAALVLLIQVLMGPFGALSADWFQIIAFVSVASMILGAFAGVVQQSFKRLLAYSSIGNIGFVLLGIAAQSQAGISAALFYMLIYLVTTVGTFAALVTLRRGNDGIDNMADLAGLSRSQPLAAYTLALMMFSVAGIPPLAGFFGKLIVLQAVVAEGLVALAVVAVIASVISAYYYLRVIKVMFFDEPKGDVARADLPGAQALMFIAIVFVLAFILKPDVALTITDVAAKSLFFG